MKTYEMLKILITKGRYTYDDMYAKLDTFFALGRITEEQYIELTGMLEQADPTEATESTEEQPTE